MKSITITLAEPITGHGGPIRTITLRPPTGGDYMSLGEPYTTVRSDDGRGHAVAVESVIAEYMRRCADIDPLLLDTVTLKDARALRDAVVGFFIQDPTA
jgi:Phage tail assembly chaperone proteins, E, or 41 or 14